MGVKRVKDMRDGGREMENIILKMDMAYFLSNTLSRFTNHPYIYYPLMRNLGVDGGI